MTWFLSYNSEDSAVARQIGALLLSQDVSVWLDEWKIGPGDSITRAINIGLDQSSGLFTIWSRHAADSRWVERELATAVSRSVNDPAFKVVPIILDDTPLPALLTDIRHIRWLSSSTGWLEEVLQAVGRNEPGRRGILRGLNHLLEAVGANYFPAAGVVACPECGSENLKEYTSTDLVHEATYAGVKCRECEWDDGGEI
jgi:hypothetical protein